MAKKHQDPLIKLLGERLILEEKNISLLSAAMSLYGKDLTGFKKVRDKLNVAIRAAQKSDLDKAAEAYREAVQLSEETMDQSGIKHLYN